MTLTRHTFFPCLVAIVAAAWAIPAGAQAGDGAKFGARDPRTCPDHNAPARGAITSVLAAQYVTCEEEHVTGGNRLYLVDSMKVQVGAGRPFQIRSDSYGEIDPSQPVYPIRGSYVRYSCDVPFTTKASPSYPSTTTVGKNCSLTNQPHASGACFKTTFGDWHCFMKDYDATLSVLRKDIPPPR